MKRIRFILLAGIVLSLGGAAALAQNSWRERSLRGQQTAVDEGNTPYDGRFVFIRLRYGSDRSGFSFGWSGWAHDYPRADVHFMKILKELTFLTPREDGSNILGLEDPEIFNYPILYMSEPGGWDATEEEIEGFRNYLTKGGFVIFDDFDGPDMYNLEEQMRRVFPDSRWVPLDGTHPIFHSFFEIDNPEDFVPPYGDMPPIFYGMFEDNDPAKRLIAIANYNNDMGEYWEFSDTGWVPIDLSNEAYKFGVNYIMYAMTH